MELLYGEGWIGVSVRDGVRMDLDHCGGGVEWGEVGVDRVGMD